MDVVVVESPAKAKTINRYLGSGYEVLASYGHVRDLPAKDGSVLPDQDFAMSWEVDIKAAKRLSDIAKAVKGAKRLILATDPDREGEAISWHVLEVLRQKKALKDVTVQRVVFNAITKQAVTEAMANPRSIDEPLVEAYLARRALDYLVGFTLSPVLWRKLPGARSAGRVQSVALRLVADREDEIERFVAKEYWQVTADLATPRGETFQARLVTADGKRIQRLDIGDAVQAKDLEGMLRGARYRVGDVESKPVRRNPAPPFSTSTLQQEASRKLGFSPARTMQIAQRLYEGVDLGGETVGLITYMRTDGVQMAEEAYRAARAVIQKAYGPGYLPDGPRRYSTKAKNAQEAHEAVRPTDFTRMPKDVARVLEPDFTRLYELIWVRAIASQMEAAELERTTATIEATAGSRHAELRATGTVVKFDGFLKLYREDEDDPENEDEKRLPAMSAGELPVLLDVKATQHFTEPPPRYTEASLVKRMEELGIGRPSTYAATLAVLKDREYVRIEKKRLHAEDKGRIVTVFLENFFRRYVEYDFTAGLEEQLDRISAGDLDWREVLREFWRDFSANVDATKDLKISDVVAALDEALAPHVFPPRADGADPRGCPSCGAGRLSLKLGKFGSFIGCSNYPECRYTRPLGAPDAEKEGANGLGGETPGIKRLGADPDSGLEVTLRDGRFGPYVQLGEREKPKRGTLPKGVLPADVDLSFALKLLSLPREIGLHPETGEPILANIGRYGPYVQHGKTYANLASPEEVFEIGINRAVTVLAEKLARGPGRFQRTQAPGKTLGVHPTLGGDIVLRDGRYGPYVAHDGVNATLPKGTDKDKLTLEAAVQLIEARRAASSTPKKTPAKRKTAPRRAAKAPVKAKPAKGAKRAEG
jgi:DNA topoisomerase-1